ncbi:putative phage tail protein [Modestobacter excelsi]|uniref:putative phage tail protein n=1 Tax=Modestobacter excelsi TaxID=2213161 RepID=UPI00110C9FE2|nr:hypothetical protein [Modestobacter excelsi]
MASVTIQQLDVRFHVEGNDQAEFTRLFERHIRAWARAVEDERSRRCRTEAERGIGDRSVDR